MPPGTETPELETPDLITAETEGMPLPDSPAEIGFWQLVKEDVDCVFDRDPAARNSWEVIFTYPGVHAIICHRIAHILWQKKWHFLARWIGAASRWFTLIEIHPAARIGRRFFIDHGCGVVIGETAEIGDDVTLYHGVTLGGTTWNRGKRHPTLEDGVIVGTGAKILGPVTIGKNAKIGANSVVFQDVAAGMTVVGIPGRVVLPFHRRRITSHGIDLDHHLMPDPVGKAIESLLERIHDLEQQVVTLNAKLQIEPPEKSPPPDPELDHAQP
jgi:serine O-acetyltransferase